MPTLFLDVYIMLWMFWKRSYIKPELCVHSKGAQHLIHIGDPLLCVSFGGTTGNEDLIAKDTASNNLSCFSSMGDKSKYILLVTTLRIGLKAKTAVLFLWILWNSWMWFLFASFLSTGTIFSPCCKVNTVMLCPLSPRWGGPG